MAKFYFSDPHYGHKSILSFDRRPWFDLASMEDDMIAIWNSRVTKNDEVYIIGDFCWLGVNVWRCILPKLNGKKFLIKGNHDPEHLPEDIIKMFGQRPSAYKEVKDGNYQVLMSHYPLISYRHDSDPNVVMLYGHVHDTVEFEAAKEAVKKYKEVCNNKGYPYQGKLYNVWCGFFDWGPATLDEILNSSKTH